MAASRRVLFVEEPIYLDDVAEARLDLSLPMERVHRAVPMLPAGLRGDYAAAGPDFTLAQDWAAYTPADHATWRTLYARQAALLPRHAAAAFRDGLARLDFAGGVPDFAEASARLFAAVHEGVYLGVVDGEPVREPAGPARDDPPRSVSGGAHLARDSRQRAGTGGKLERAGG